MCLLVSCQALTWPMCLLVSCQALTWPMCPLVSCQALVYGGALLYVFSKSAKFSLFKPAEEMVYISLDEEGRTKGKAAIDVVGSQAGKSGGSILQQVGWATAKGGERGRGGGGRREGRKGREVENWWRGRAWLLTPARPDFPHHSPPHTPLGLMLLIIVITPPPHTPLGLMLLIIVIKPPPHTPPGLVLLIIVITPPPHTPPGLVLLIFKSMLKNTSYSTFRCPKTFTADPPTYYACTCCP